MFAGLDKVSLLNYGATLRKYDVIYAKTRLLPSKYHVT